MPDPKLSGFSVHRHKQPRLSVLSQHDVTFQMSVFLSFCSLRRSFFNETPFKDIAPPSAPVAPFSLSGSMPQILIQMTIGLIASPLGELHLPDPLIDPFRTDKG